MADTPDKPTETPKPATTRRRAPRKTTATATAGTAKAKVRNTAKRVAAKTEHAVEKASDTAIKVERSVARAVKPRKSSRPKPTTGTRRQTSSSNAGSVLSHKPGKWSIAAIAGGIAAAGATIAALLSLRGSSRKTDADKPRTPEGAEGVNLAVVDQADAA